MPRECAQCGKYQNKCNFSTNQWRKGDGQSRCEDCVSQNSCPQDSDGNCIKDVAALVEYIVDKLKKSSTGMLAASELGGDIRRWSAWSSVIDNAGGLKLFCLNHADKIKWNSSGTGQVQLVKKGSIPIGAMVTITTKNPSYGWGDARSWSVGKVQSFTGTTYIVDFPEVKRWKGEEKDLTISNGVDRSKMDIGSVDPDFNNFCFVRNKGLGKFEFSGAGLKEGGRGLWEYGFVQASKKLTQSCSYFEMKIIKHRSDGVGIGLCGESFLAGNMVGWDDDSIGFHSHNGNFFYKTAEKKDSVPLGPPSTNDDTLGCGVLFESDKPKAVYFCRNEIVIGRFPLRSEDSETLFPVVSGGSPAIVQIDLTASPPAISMACSLRTFEFEGKYNDSSKSYKTITIKGLPNIKGEIPVIFNGYKDIEWIPQARLRKTESPRVEEFSTLEQAFKVAADGDTIEVRDCGVHLMRDSIEVKTAITVRGPSDLARKPTISLGGGFVFKTSANVSLQNIFVKSVGGDTSKSFTQGGAAAVVMQAGNLSIASCWLASEKGSAACLDEGKLEYFNIESSVIGPCGRHGFVLCVCAQKSVVKDVEIKDIGMIGLVVHGGDVDVTKCTIKNCETGLSHSGSEDKETLSKFFGGPHFGSMSSSTVTVRDSSVTNCRGCAVLVNTNHVPCIAARAVILQDCKIDESKIGVQSEGEKSTVSYDKNTSISNCNDEQKVINCGKIVAEVPTPTTETTPSSPDQEKEQAGTTVSEDGKNQQDGGKIVAKVTTPSSVDQIKQILEAAGVNYSDCTEKHELEELLAKLRDNPGMGCARASGGGRESSDQDQDQACTTAREVKSLVKEQSKNSSTVSGETINFARYCRLLMDVGREVLMTLFKENYRKEEGVHWEESCGPRFLGAKFPDRVSQSKLGKHLIDSIRSGKCHEWDITLLSSLLIFIPGYVKGDASGKKAVEALRKERNDLAHDADVLARLTLTDEQFKIKWGIVSASLEVLIELLLGDKAAWRIKIDSIAKEEMGKSALEPLFEGVKEDMKRILDDLEDVRDKASEAHRMAEGAARMSQVVALDAKIEKLESLLNKQGHVDQNCLPREVVLSNQKRYRLLKQVGKGGMGTVFEAKLIAADSDDGKLALKICDADASGRAEREAQILQQLSDLNHDNIVKFFDSAFEDSHLVIVMELIKGRALDEWLEHRYSAGNSGVTFTETQPIVKQLVQGMKAVHAIDIAHRDLKPANLIFDQETGKLVIVDFGLSKQHNNNTNLTAANCQLGTFLYMSPEQFKGDIKEISFSSDVWAIGVVWHEMLTSFTPFEPACQQAHADSSTTSKRRTWSKWEEREMMNKVAETGSRKLPLLEARNVPSQIISIIAKCLFFEKKDRYEDAEDLFQQIEPVFQELENKSAGMESADSFKGMESADSVKPFKLWCASQVAELVRSIGGAFANKANQIDANGINGEYFLAMLKNNDLDLTTSVEDGGLGFSRLQVNIVSKKIEELGGFTCSGGGANAIDVFAAASCGDGTLGGSSSEDFDGCDGRLVVHTFVPSLDVTRGITTVSVHCIPTIALLASKEDTCSPTCGDSLVARMEECDDGDSMEGEDKSAGMEQNKAAEEAARRRQEEEAEKKRIEEEGRKVAAAKEAAARATEEASRKAEKERAAAEAAARKEAEEKAAAAAKREEEERLAADAAAAAEEADRKLQEERERLRQEEERARAEAAARKENQRREEEWLRQEEEENKRLEAEGRAQEAERKRQEEETERRRMEEESAGSVPSFKSRCASEPVEPGWACSSSTCTTS